MLLQELVSQLDSIKYTIKNINRLQQMYSDVVDFYEKVDYLNPYRPKILDYNSVQAFDDETMLSCIFAWDENKDINKHLCEFFSSYEHNIKRLYEIYKTQHDTISQFIFEKHSLLKKMLNYREIKTPTYALLDCGYYLLEIFTTEDDNKVKKVVIKSHRIETPSGVYIAKEGDTFYISSNTLSSDSMERIIESYTKGAQNESNPTKYLSVTLGYLKEFYAEEFV